MGLEQTSWKPARQPVYEPVYDTVYEPVHKPAYGPAADEAANERHIRTLVMSLGIFNRTTGTQAGSKSAR